MKTVRMMALTVLATFCVGARAQTSSSALLPAIEKLVSDVKADIGNSQVSKQEILNLQTAFKNAAATAHKPSPTSVATLRTLGATIRSQGSATSQQKMEFKADLAAVLKSAGLTESEIEDIESAVLAIYQSSNFSQQEAMQILQDFRAIFSALPSPPPQG
jgi:hypothetical protein